MTRCNLAGRPTLGGWRSLTSASGVVGQPQEDPIKGREGEEHPLSEQEPAVPADKQGLGLWTRRAYGFEQDGLGALNKTGLGLKNKGIRNATGIYNIDGTL